MRSKWKFCHASWALLVSLCTWKIANPTAGDQHHFGDPSGRNGQNQRFKLLKWCTSLISNSLSLCMSGPMLLGQCRIWTVVVLCVIYFKHKPNMELAASTIHQQHPCCGSWSGMPSRCWVSSKSSVDNQGEPLPLPTNKHQLTSTIIVQRSRLPKVRQLRHLSHLPPCSSCQCPALPRPRAQRM